MPVEVPTPVEIPQVQFLDKLFMPVEVPTPVELPQVQFLDKVHMPVVVVVSGTDGQSRFQYNTQHTTHNTQHTTHQKQHTRHNKQDTTNKTQQTTNKTQQTTNKTQTTNNEQRTTNNEQRTTINDQRSTINDQRSTINDQRTTNNEQRTTNNEQRTTNNEQRTTNNEQRTTNNEQRTKNKQQTTNRRFHQTGCPFFVRRLVCGTLAGDDGFRCSRHWNLRGEAEEAAPSALVVATRAANGGCGAGYSDPPLALQGGYCELSSDDGRPTGWSGQRHCLSRGRRRRCSGTPASCTISSSVSMFLCRRWENSCRTLPSSLLRSCRWLPTGRTGGGGGRGGLQGSRPGQGSTASSSRSGIADEAGQGVFRTFPQSAGECGL